MALKITFEAQTDVGLERSDNQDHFGSSRQENVEFFIVCDGMGGHAGGSTASRLGVQAIENTLEESDADVPLRMETAIHVANDAIHSMAAERRELRGMGTTVAILGIDQQAEQAHVAHVGDSRIYRLRGNEFERLTRDHTMVQRLVDEGIITEEDAEHHPQSNVISRSLGGHPVVEVEHGPNVLDLQDGDVFLLCSDGLCGLVSEPDMAHTLAHLPPDEATTRLIEQANDAGGHDNITAQVILIGEQAAPFEAAALQLIHPPKGPSAIERQAQIEAADLERKQRKLQEELAAKERESAREKDATAVAESRATHDATNGRERNGAAAKKTDHAAASGAPVLEDQSTGKLLFVLAGLIVLLVLLVIGLILKTSAKPEENVVVPEITVTDDADAEDDVPLYLPFDDSEPQPVYDVEYDDVYDVYDGYEDAPDAPRERAEKLKTDEEKADDKDAAQRRANPFADDVGVAGGKNPAFQAPSRENPFGEDDEEATKTPKRGAPSSPESSKGTDIPKPATPTPSKSNPFEDPAEPAEPAPKSSRTRAPETSDEPIAPAKPPAPPVKRGENPF